MDRCCARLFRDHQIKERPTGDDGSGPDQIPLIRIDHDSTQAQREYKRELIAKAKEESSVGPIRYVVRGPPWALRKVPLLRRQPTPSTPAQNAASPPQASTQPQRILSLLNAIPTLAVVPAEAATSQPAATQ